MWCNRKTDGLAVTPHRKTTYIVNVTKIWQLRRREKLTLKSKFISTNS